MNFFADLDEGEEQREAGTVPRKREKTGVHQGLCNVLSNLGTVLPGTRFVPQGAPIGLSARNRKKSQDGLNCHPSTLQSVLCRSLQYEF
jgi:hypothetical protein